MTVIVTNPVERTRFLKFTIVGLVGAAVDFGSLNILSTLLHLNPVFSSIISFGMAVGSNFIWNRYWIYPDSRSKSIRRQGAQFTLVNLIGLLIRTPIFAFLQPFFVSELIILSASKNYGISPKVLGENLALAVAVVVVMMWNFFVNRYWTYNDIDNIDNDIDIED